MIHIHVHTYVHTYDISFDNGGTNHQNSSGEDIKNMAM